MESLASPFLDTLRQIEELMAEARRLRERINHELLRPEEAPFVPERRTRYERHEPDRRRRQQQGAEGAVANGT